jgi:hypothetical protein
VRAWRSGRVTCSTVTVSTAWERVDVESEVAAALGQVAHDGSGYALTEQGRDLIERLLPLGEWAASWQASAAN